MRGFCNMTSDFNLYKTTLCFFVMVSLSSSSLPAQEPGTHTFFKESTFRSFYYSDGIFDEDYTNALENMTRKTFPKANVIKCASFVTTNDPRDVVSYFTNLSGQRFFKIDNKFIYIFSEIGGKPASRIEIYPLEIPRLAEAFTPTRINLIIVSYPINTSYRRKSRTVEDLKELAGRFFYNGDLREDIAHIEMDELGADADVYVVSTDDSFLQVWRFFRRRFGRISYLPAWDGEVFTRDFEIDVTRALRLDGKMLYIRVDENPMITDNQGNSQVYLGKTFIKYTVWYNNDNS
jgi:hypothetical protein